VVRQVKARLSEGSWSWSWEKDWVWGQGSLLATISPKEGLQQVVVDHQGSAALLVNRCGRRIAELATNLWGLDVGDATQNPERHRYTGHLRDINAPGRAWDDFDQMHARTYFPYTARFLSPDPGRDYDLSHPQSFNLYAYVRNNPVNAVDPKGRWFTWHNPIASGDRSTIYTALVEIARRPDGQALLRDVGNDPNFRVVLSAGELFQNKTAREALAAAGFDARRALAWAKRLSITYGVTARVAGGAKVILDTAILRFFGRLTGYYPAKTLGHEVGMHVQDFRADPGRLEGSEKGQTTARLDAPPPAGLALGDMIAEAILSQPPVLSFEEAKKLVDELLAFGAEMEKLHLVNVTSESSPRTGK
jgi:RHS repeat-associated protein